MNDQMTVKVECRITNSGTEKAHLLRLGQPVLLDNKVYHVYDCKFSDMPSGARGVMVTLISYREDGAEDFHAEVVDKDHAFTCLGIAPLAWKSNTVIQKENAA